MSTTPTRLTELEAVNIMLGTIGEAPVNNLSGTNTTDVAMAKSVLSEVNRAIQTIGWHFNTEKDYELTPEVSSGNIILPPNCVRVDEDTDATFDLTIRSSGGNFILYDRINHTSVFSNSLKVEMVLLFPFEEIPEPAKWYITVRAARIFQDRAVGSTTLHGFTEKDEASARAALVEFEGDTADHSIFNNYDIARIIER